MDLLLELLEDPAYRHVLLNHLPITGLALSCLVLGWALFGRRWESIRFALVLVLLTSLSGVVVMEAGEDAYPFVYDGLDGVGRSWLDYHAHLADRWGKLLAVNGLLAAVALGLGAWRSATQTRAGALILVTTLVALVAAAMIADAGGRIRHPEFRLSDPPAYESPGRLR